MEIKDYTLRPKIRFLKVIGFPVVGFMGFIIYSFIANPPARIARSYKQIPVFFRLDSPDWILFLSMLFLVAMVFFFFAFIEYPDRDQSMRVLLKNRETVIECPDFKMTLKSSSADVYQISISRFWSLFFPRYYRVGKAKIRIKEDTYKFMFPVRNMEVAKTIQSIRKKT